MSKCSDPTKHRRCGCDGTGEVMLKPLAQARKIQDKAFGEIAGMCAIIEWTPSHDERFRQAELRYRTASSVINVLTEVER